MQVVDTFFQNLKEGNNLIIFFDNDETHERDMKNNVTNCLSIKVSDEISEKYEDSLKSNEKYMLEFKNADETWTNEYAKLMHDNYNPKDEKFPICDGITQEYVDLFVTPFIAKASGDKQKIAIFDFDRTLTIMEGFLSPPDEEYKEMFDNFKPHDVALFLFGGQKRIDMLISMYKSLKDANFQVLVLTNNPTCSNSVGRLFFISIITQIFEKFENTDLICSDSGNGLSKSKAFNNFLTRTEKPKRRMLVRAPNINVTPDPSPQPPLALDSSAQPPLASDSSATANPSMFSKLKLKIPSFTLKNLLKGGKQRRTKRRKTIKRKKTHRRRRQ